jgi:hypothetical protein
MTIGMNNLGKSGGIGEQLFQYASLVGIAKSRGFDFRIPEETKLSECFEMLHCGNRYGQVDGDEVIIDDDTEFCEELMTDCPNHATLTGSFQCEDYFIDAKRLLKWDLRFKKEILEKVVSDIEEMGLSEKVPEYDDEYHQLCLVSKRPELADDSLLSWWGVWISKNVGELK